MIHVIFDTSGIGQNKNVSEGNYSALKTLVEFQVIQVHIPFIVKKEVETQEFLFYKQQHDKIKSAIKAFDKIIKSNKLNNSISIMKSQLEDLDKEITQDYSRFANAWINDLNSKIYDITLDQTNKAWESYFSGTAPFTSEKVRADIPDSFICRSIEDIVNSIATDKKFVLIAKDEKVINTFKDNKKITIFKSIEEFITADDIKITLADTDKTKEFSSKFKHDEMIEFEDIETVHINDISSLSSLIETHETENLTIDGYISRHLEESIVDETFEGMPFSNDHGKAATILSCNDVFDIDINFKDTIHYGKDQFGFNFTAKTIVEAEFYIDKVDYYSNLFTDSLKSPFIDIENWNKHVLRAVNIVTLIVSGVVTIDLNLDSESLVDLEFLPPDEFKETFNTYIENAILNIDTISNLSIADTEI